MNEDFYQDGFEDFLKESSDDLRMHPSDRVWQGLHARMHPAQKWPYILGGAGIFALGLATGIWLNLSRPADTPSRSIPVAPAPSMAIGAQEMPTWSRPVIEAAQNGFRPLPTASLLTEGHRMGVIADQGSQAFATRTGNAIPSLTHLFARTGSWSALAQPSLIEPSTDRQAPRHGEMAPLPTAPTGRPAGATSKPSFISGSAADRFLQGLGSIRRRTILQVYLTPSVSYRNLIGQATRSNYIFPNNYSINAGFGAPTDVNDAVTHRPGIGLEAGSAMQYTLTRSLRVKAGLQFNLTNYDIEAYTYAPEMAPLSAARGAGGGATIQSVSYFRNAAGFSRTWLRNSHFMVSMPVGLEYTVAGNRKLSFTVASTLQPTYMLRNKSYLISTNLKNYAEEPALYRKWNLNAGAEAYLSMNTGSYRWIMGPQIRYQLLSSYKQDYPIQEHLVDFGFKVGIQKTIH